MTFVIVLSSALLPLLALAIAFHFPKVKNPFRGGPFRKPKLPYYYPPPPPPARRKKK